MVLAEVTATSPTVVASLVGAHEIVQGAIRVGEGVGVMALGVYIVYDAYWGNEEDTNEDDPWYGWTETE